VSSPIQIARRYAEALADAAEAQNMLAQTAEELHAFATMVAESRELYDVLASPAIGPQDKSAVLEALIGRAKPTTIVANFLRVLLRNMRIHHIDAVDRAFADEVDRRTGVVMAEVTTARPLTDGERGVLSSRLAAMTGKKVKLTFATDDALIGGVVTRIGSRIYDGSVRSRLDRIKEQMAGQIRA
jgi:F-type H+-transporting ATPase subunit delta